MYYHLDRKMFNRVVKESIKKDLFRGKVISLLGARQVGKTTLLKEIAEEMNMPYLWLNGDEPDDRLLLSNVSSTELKKLYGVHQLIIIDEAQRIENIGLTLKLSIDTIPDVQVIATGSSAFDLANSINEPLTGRKYEYFLYPLSFVELVEGLGRRENTRLLENRLIYGSYPAVVTADDPKRILQLLTDSYLYKDLFAYEQIKKTSLFSDILKSLALQVGREVSYNELANSLGVNKATIEKYIDLLEQTFVIFRLSSFSKNVRNELKKSKKIYFYDNGVRNAIIKQFQPLALRNDVGALWENYIISERIKRNSYKRNYAEMYFWRTTQQQEVDYIELYDGKLDAYEFKWNGKTKVKLPLTFSKNYSINHSDTISPKNYDEFLS